MHVFQPYPIDQIELNPFTIQGNTGLCVTASVGDEVETTGSMFCSFGRLWDKDVVIAFVRESRYAREVMEKSEFFSLSFFKDDAYKNGVKFLKAAYTKDENKIKDSGFTINRHIDIPFIDEAHFVILCDKLASIPVTKESMEPAFIKQRIRDKFYSTYDFHHIFVGEILQILAR